MNSFELIRNHHFAKFLFKFKKNQINMKNNIIWNNWETFRANSKKPTLMVEYFCSSKGLWKTSTIFGSLPQIGLISWVTFRVNPKTLKMASKCPKISYFYMTYLKSKNFLIFLSQWFWVFRRGWWWLTVKTLFPYLLRTPDRRAFCLVFIVFVPFLSTGDL